jgi:hypothetical protein
LPQILQPFKSAARASEQGMAIAIAARGIGAGGASR